MSFYSFARAAANFFLTATYSIRYEGLENIPDHGFILVCNHQSYLDPVLLGMRLKKRQLIFMAKEELFQKPVLGPIIRKLGAFPVVRGKRDTSAVDTAIQTVKEGKMLALFPEGTRSKTGEPLRPKSGAVVIAARTGADIVPAAITFRNNRRRFRNRIVVRYGGLIPNEQLGLTDAASPAQIKQASRFVMDRIIGLRETTW